MKTANLTQPGEHGHARARGHVGRRAGGTGLDFIDNAGNEVDGVTELTLGSGLTLADSGDGAARLGAELGLTDLTAITPAQLVANTDDWDPVDSIDTTIDLTAATIIRASTDASRNLTGIVAPDPAVTRLVIVENVGAFDLVLKHNVTSTAANRFYCPNDTDVTLQKDSTAILVYDTTSTRWRVIGGGGGGGAGVTYGTPAIVLGTAAAAGSIDEAIRRDSTIIAFDATAPTTQAFGDAAATGSAAIAARRDHKHAWPALGTTAAAIGTSAGGSATTPSKSDHVHATGAGTPSTQAFGDAASTGTGPAAAMTDHKHAMPAKQRATIVAIIDGGTATITTGVKSVFVQVPFACTLKAVRLLADRDGALTIDILRTTYSSFNMPSTHPVSGDSIVGGSGTKPNIAATGDKSEDTSFTSWSDTTLDAGDILAFEVTVATTIRMVSIQIEVERD